MNFGWTNTFGGFGSGSGVKKPANPNDILQWLTSYDGVTPFVDKKEIVASPAVTGVNVLSSSGAQIITIPAIVGTENATNQGTAGNPTVAAQTLTFGAGTIYNVEVDGIGAYPCEEGSGLPYDVSVNGNHATANTATWTTADGIESANLLNGFTRTSDLYSATEPTQGYEASRTFNATTGTVGDLFDLIATMVHDAKHGFPPAYTITGHTPTREFNPNTANVDTLYDVASTIADDLPSTASLYTLTAPTTNTYTFNPITDEIDVALDVLGTLLIDLKTYEIVG